MTVSDSQVLATTYKSTDGIPSHCKTVLDIVIVYHGVYRAFPTISRNSSLGRRSRFYFDYTIPVLEKLIAAAKRGASEYFICYEWYESLRPKEESEIKEPKAA